MTTDNWTPPMRRFQQRKKPKVKVVSDKEADACDYLVCMPWDDASPFKDNLKGTCCKCGIVVMYRWHAPRKPKRICIKCMAENLNAAR